MKRKLWLLLALLVVFSMIAAQCAPAPATEAPPAATEAPAEEPEEPAEAPAPYAPRLQPTTAASEQIPSQFESR